MSPANDNHRMINARDASRWPGPVALILLGLIRIYRYTLSALIGRTCRFLPTCSEYGETAIKRFGAWRGGWLTFFRFLRCRPGVEHGYDPVPEVLRDQGWRFWRYGGGAPHQKP